MRTRAETHLSFTFENNIVYFNTGKLLGSNWSGDEASFRMRKNLISDARAGASPETLKFAGSSLSDWRKTGSRSRFRGVADPLFVNPGGR